MMVRTPSTKAKTMDDNAPELSSKGKRSPTPVAHSSHTSNVRRSIGEWESGKSDSQSGTPTSPKKTKIGEASKPKLKETSLLDKTVTLHKTPVDANMSPSTKVSDRMAEARACVTKAKLHLNNSRNLKTEIKAEVTQAIDRLYQLLKETGTVKGSRQPKQTNDTQEGHEEEKQPVKTKEESELWKKLEEHTRLLQENNEKMEKLQKTIETQQEIQQSQTYASVAAVLPRKQFPEQAALHSVVVTAVDEKETGEEVLNRIRKAVNAKESGISVEKIRKAKDRKVIVGCKTEEERQKIKERLQGTTELIVEEVKNKDPLVILRDVLKYNSDEDVLSALKNQNTGTLGEIGDQKLEIAFKKRTRNPHTHHIVMRVSPKIWQRLVQAESVKIDLQRVKVADQSPLVQCSLCLGYGHGRRFCRETTEKCCHCGGLHLKDDCPEWRNGDVPSCTNCRQAKLDRADHNAFSGECPIRRKWEALARAKIAYC